MAQTVLFLPGLLCDAALWQAQVEVLSATWTCVVADLTKDEAIEAMVARAMANLPDRFAVCGLSMGGYVALGLMRLAPERISRLCLIDTTARADTQEQARRRRVLMAMTRGNNFRGVTPRLLPQLVHPDRLGDAALTSTIMDMAARVGRDAFLRQQMAIMGRPDSRPILKDIRVPTHILHGDADRLIPLDHAVEMANAIPGARMNVVRGCGHLPTLEDPAALTLLLSKWLTGMIRETIAKAQVSFGGTMLRFATLSRALIALIAVTAVVLPSTANAYWRGGVWFGVGPFLPYYPPVVVTPPVVYAPPPVVVAPPAPFAVVPPGFQGPGGYASAPPEQTAAGPSCYAGAYVCPLRTSTPIGAQCSCPGNNGRVSGTVR
jgi:pimeloyl-ACP methyl ester carboxylesterase